MQVLPIQLPRQCPGFSNFPVFIPKCSRRGWPFNAGYRSERAALSLCSIPLLDTQDEKGFLLVCTPCCRCS